jgi:hypothetical protein
MKASCALTCGTCENILEPILNKKSNDNEQPEIVSTTAITEVEEQATSVENTSETVKAESESASENSEETAEITKISDNEDLTSEAIDTVEVGSSENETIEIDDSITPNNAKSDESSVSITVVTTESSVSEEAEEKHDENDGKDHSGHSHNNDKSSGTETICWSVLVVVLTFLVS